MLIKERISNNRLSEFMRFLASGEIREGDRLPPLTEMSRELGISIASLREQMEVARAMGLVEVRPRTGIRRLPYDFKPAVVQSLIYADAIDSQAFRSFSDLRNHIEMTYWHTAVDLLTPEDHQTLRLLVANAREKLGGEPIQIPHDEHRQLHLTIYKRLNNPFVSGILEAYWEVYEAIGLNVYTDLNYLETVWDYHARMVDLVCQGNIEAGYAALVEHMDLIFQRSK